MSNRKKINKFKHGLKLNGELKDKYRFSLKWPLRIFNTKKCNFLSSPTFNLCGSSWTCHIYPTGIDETSEFLSIRLISLSNEEVFASYSIIIKNHKNENNDYTWKDPEQIIIFSSYTDGDNEWGNDEFISLDHELFNDDEYIRNDQITFEVEIEVFGRDDLKTETLSAAVLQTADQSILLKLADEELLELTKQLPKLRDSVAQKKQEDGIVTEIGIPSGLSHRNTYSSSGTRRSSTTANTTIAIGSNGSIVQSNTNVTIQQHNHL